MASSSAVWGIDIGQCALKAMRCRAHDDDDKIIVDAIDYIEYPKILSQPDANPIELVSDAIKQFLSRNSVRGERVAISVPGQNGLARFIKLPPVEAKKIPDIVRYEARQQIPFDLNDVIWDFQRMGGGSEASGFLLETEIGLFAMKRDAVFRALEPFQRAKIEVDIVQLTPLAIYNFILFDQLKADMPSPEDYDPEAPSKYTAVVSLGTDATDLVVTNGFRVWQRSVPLGGNHFTKALTKEMKLTFAKAEHLKRNAATAQDAKAVFQAMRPIFNDLQTELQRSLGFFGNIDRNAEIARIVAVGNAFKLPGLRRFLAQNIGLELNRVESFRGLVRAEALATPAFKDNILSFGVCYGLCLQALGRGGLRTNLLPKQILHDRIIRKKKPWAVAAAAVALLGCAISYTAHALQYDAVEKSHWTTVENAAGQEARKSQDLINRFRAEDDNFKHTEEIGRHLVNNMENRLRWLELVKVINSCLPQEIPKEIAPTDPVALSNDVMSRNQLQITSIDSQAIDDVSKWYETAKNDYRSSAENTNSAAPQGGAPNAPGGGALGGADAQTDSGPKGKGVIVQIAGHHYHNGGHIEGREYVMNTLIKDLASPKMQAVGISYPVLMGKSLIYPERIPIPGPKQHGEKAATTPSILGINKAPPPEAGKAPEEEKLDLKRFDFRVQFVWQYKSPAEQEAALAALKETTKGAVLNPPGGAANVAPSAATAGGAASTNSVPNKTTPPPLGTGLPGR